MPTRARRLCLACHEPFAGTGTCEACRGTAAERGYGAEHRNEFREGVLTPARPCVLCGERLATVADHYPWTRRELVAQGKDPNDPQYGRALCGKCHSKETIKVTRRGR